MAGCDAVIVGGNFSDKRSESNFKQIDGFSIGTVLIDRALFVFLAHDRFELWFWKSRVDSNLGNGHHICNILIGDQMLHMKTKNLILLS